MDLNEKDFVIIVQCDIVMQRCSGLGCEQAFTGRKGGFADYPADKQYRTIYFTCGGCCGRAINRKLTNAMRRLRRSDIPADRIVVQLSTCMTKSSHHGPKCPHLDYIIKHIETLGLDYRMDTVISKKSQALREKGVYEA